MQEIYLASTVLMGILVIAVAATMARMGQRATPSGHAGTRSKYADWSDRTEKTDSRVVAIASRPVTWTITFIGLVAAILAGAVLLVSEGEFGELAMEAAEPVLLGVGGAVLLGYLFFGSFFAARDRFDSTAIGVAIASLVLGFFGLIAVVIAVLTA